jgi:hypothetical protein
MSEINMLLPLCALSGGGTLAAKIPCVQRRLARSAGVSPAGVIARYPVARIAGRRAVDDLKPIDNAIVRMVSESSGRRDSERRCSLESRLLRARRGINTMEQLVEHSCGNEPPPVKPEITAFVTSLATRRVSVHRHRIRRSARFYSSIAACSAQSQARCPNGQGADAGTAAGRAQSRRGGGRAGPVGRHDVDHRGAVVRVRAVAQGVSRLARSPVDRL